MICEYANTVADFEPIEEIIFTNVDFAVLLRHSINTHPGLISIELKNTSVAACRVKSDGPAIL